MKSHFYNEKNGLWYEAQGEHYLPCLTLPAESKVFGTWGQRHLRYIRRNKSMLYTSLLTTGKLNEYLAELDTRASDMYTQLVNQMAQQQGVNEQLKENDQMEWVGRMNTIRNAASEIVYAEVIFA